MEEKYYEDQRMKDLQEEKNTAISEVEKLYGDMIQGNKDHYQGMIDATKEAAEKQSQLQQQQTDFAVEQIEQQKKETEESFRKEQSAAWTDFKKQTDPHGVAAEQLAQAGLTGSGYAESSRVAMYNAYQNRVAAARAGLEQAMTSYNNAITQARLTNDATLAQIALDALQQRLAYEAQVFQMNNELLLAQYNQVMNLKDYWGSREQALLAQLQAENQGAPVTPQEKEHAGILMLDRYNLGLDPTMPLRDSQTNQPQDSKPLTGIPYLMSVGVQKALEDPRVQALQQIFGKNQ